MRNIDLAKNIMKSIKSTLSYKELCNLCSYLQLSSNGIKKVLQERLDTYIRSQTLTTLLIISNKIDEYSTYAKRGSSISSTNTPDNSILDINTLNGFKADSLNDHVLLLAPIDLHNEVGVINRNEIVIIHFTNYMQTHTIVPKEINHVNQSRSNSVSLPNMLLNVTVQSSPFYCGVVCLHPLSFLIPQNMPSINNNGRSMSKAVIQFSLSDAAQKLIAKNIIKISNKIEYKWQVLLRFIAVDPILSLPNEKESVSPIIPPFLTVDVNNCAVALWDILPSNTRIKEGKRHPKPVNITDKLNVSNSTNSCYRQNININWWQTPGIFQYYYVGVYLERKLSVQEILELFVSNKHVNILPIEATYNLIKTKLNDENDDGDTDLVVASVLPIQLLCPIGKCRIKIPLRTLNCQHLQCFDAEIFLSMNERRAIWKCPICDSNAITNELFCDVYFQNILNEFKNNENINDINVRADGSYIPIYHRNDDKVQSESNKAAESIGLANDEQMIILDSEDEDSSLTSTSHLNKENTPEDCNKLIDINSNNREDITQADSQQCVSSKTLQIKLKLTNIPIHEKSMHKSINDKVQATMSADILKTYDNILSTQSFSTSPIPSFDASNAIYQHDMPIVSPIIPPFYASNYSTPPPAVVNTSKNHKVNHHVSKSFVQSQIPKTWNACNTSLSEVIQTPSHDIISHFANKTLNQVSIETPIFSQIPIIAPLFPKGISQRNCALVEEEVSIFKAIVDPIPAPSFPSGILQSKFNLLDNQITKPIPSITHLLSKEHSKVPTKDASKCHGLFSVVPAPIATPLFDSLIKENLGLSISNSLPDFVSPIKSQPSNTNIIPYPISCPVINPLTSIRAQPDYNTASFQNIQTVSQSKNSDASKKVPSTAAFSVTIPEVTIDLISDDDDDACVINEYPEMYDISHSKKYTNGRKSLPNTSIESNSFAHYKPLKKGKTFSLQNRSVINKNIIYDKRPIDLTGDDDDITEIPSAHKKSKLDFSDDYSSVSSSDSLSSGPKRMISNFRTNFDSNRH